jgi:hypothetical protein
MPFNHSDEQALLAGTLTLDCPVIELIPECSDSQEPSYRGSGLISISAKGGFDIRLYFAETNSESKVFRERLFWPKWTAGELVEDQLYYRLEATDLDNRCWRSTRILPNKTAGMAGAVVRAETHKLILSETNNVAAKGNHLRLVFGSKIDFPANEVVNTEKRVGEEIRESKRERSAARFSTSGIDFEITAGGATTILGASSTEHPFDERTIHNIADAFTFFTGNTAKWNVRQVWNEAAVETHIQASAGKEQSTRVGAPLVLQHNRGDWTLFERYFAYGLSSASEHHPLGALVHGVLAGGMAYIDVQALTLSVSVENLLANHFRDIAPMDKRIIENIANAKRLVCEASDLDESFKKRIDGALSAMTRPRAKDLLIELRKRALVGADLVTHYEKLRNKSAHGTTIPEENFQLFLDQCNAALTLFYQLIFLRIGYTGKYTAYAARDYPCLDFTALLVNRIVTEK